jgi:hypothetical protein
VIWSFYPVLGNVTQVQVPGRYNLLLCFISVFQELYQRAAGISYEAWR